MKRLNKLLNKKGVKKGLIITGAILLGFAIFNLLIYVIFMNRTYPGTKIQNQNIGNISKTNLEQKLGKMNLLPDSLTFSYQDKSETMNTKDIGISVDSEKTTQSAIKQRSWLPVANFFKHQPVMVVIKTDDTYKSATGNLANTFKKDPTDAKVVINGSSFEIAPEADGYSLDTNQLQQSLQDSISSGSNRVDVPVIITKPKVTQKDLASNLKDLKERQTVSITYHYKDKSKKLSPEEIMNLHEVSGTSYILTDAKIKSFLVKVGKNFGIGIKNINDAVRDTKASIQNKKTLDFTFEPTPLKTYTYCTGLRGVDASALSVLQSKLAGTFSDERGWGLDGQINFVPASSGCDLTVWLASADQMPSFGSICDTSWSCTVYPNVIINYDRWQYATTPWNQNGGSLDEYRAMAINHEVGHWLGFGHSGCPGAGQSAPVMEQQSIDLQGCKFNAWPLPNEQATLRQRLGI